ncbi:MAG TPA: hypothetical protein PKH09_12320, partial [Parvularculaceae bacterium]|nr:hypothetical protein [Parvularculaceae bacterium]
MIRIMIAAMALTFATAAAAQDWKKSAREADFVIENFEFRSGETLADLRLHYTTLGKPKRAKDRRIATAGMILGIIGTIFLVF